MPIMIRSRRGCLPERRSVSTPDVTLFEREGFRLESSTDVALTPEQLYFDSVNHYRSSARKKISVGSRQATFSRTMENPTEGWAKILNLMRTFSKVKKQDAIERSKNNWNPIKHDIEYLFRYMGLGYTNEPLPKAVLFSQGTKFYPKESMRLGNLGFGIIELPDKKLIRIGKAIKSILYSPKCYKELKEHEINLNKIANEMILIGTHPSSRTGYGNDHMQTLGKCQHIYIFYSNVL